MNDMRKLAIKEFRFCFVKHYFLDFKENYKVFMVIAVKVTKTVG